MCVAALVVLVTGRRIGSAARAETGREVAAGTDQRGRDLALVIVESVVVADRKTEETETETGEEADLVIVVSVVVLVRLVVIGRESEDEADLRPDEAVPPDSVAADVFRAPNAEMSCHSPHVSRLLAMPI